MNPKPHKHRYFSPAFFAASILLIAFSLMLSGCGESAAKSKKKKSKADEEETTSTEKGPKEEKGNSPEKGEDKAEGGKKEEDKKHGGHSDEKMPSADEVWADLMKGNQLFRQGKYSAGDLLGERPALAKGQQPKVIVLTCSDSRVPPELIFGKNTGDLFVVRDAGNIVDELALGSMEYAVEHLHSKAIVILGHESCGAVAAAVSGEKMPTVNLQAIVDKILPALDESKECPVGGKMNSSCVELNVKNTEKAILAKSEVLKEAVEKGLPIIKAVYKLDSGEAVRLN